MQAILEAATRHRSAGDPLILVLGTEEFESPAARRWLVADLVLHAEPTVCTHHATTGPHRAWNEPAFRTGRKSLVIVETMARLGLDAARCFGYGDHHAGAETLGLVGNPRVIGHDILLAEHAMAHGWPILTSPSTAPPPLTGPPGPRSNACLHPDTCPRTSRSRPEH